MRRPAALLREAETMKRFLPALLSVLISFSSGLWARTVTIAVGDWPPYTSTDLPQARLAQTIASEAFALEGIDVVYRYCPWLRCYVEARKGNVDATLPWFRSEKRDKAFIFSQEPLLPITEGVFPPQGDRFQVERLR